MTASFNSLASLLDADRKCDHLWQKPGRATVTGTIWTLHRVIANPDSSGDDVRTAKRLLLRLLEKTRAFPRLEMFEAEMHAETSPSRTVATEGSRNARSAIGPQRRSQGSNRSRSSASPRHGRS